MKHHSRAVAVPMAVLLLGGCGQSQPDYTPIGDGIRAFGICVVVVAVINGLTQLVMAEGKKPKDSPTTPRSLPQRKKPKGGV